MAKNPAGGRIKTPEIFPRLLVCEGYEDHCFFDRLIADNSVQKFHIIHADGNSKFYERVEAFKLNPIYGRIRHILFVADNDDDPKGRFENVCGQIERLFGPTHVPTERRKKKGTNPSVQVLMVPWDEDHGTIESVCMGPARLADKNSGKLVDDIHAFVRADKWDSRSRSDKAWLRMDLAIRCERDPFISMGDSITDTRHQDLLNFKSTSLNKIITYLNTIGS